jgi:hypothetical protein
LNRLVSRLALALLLIAAVCGVVAGGALAAAPKVLSPSASRVVAAKKTTLRVRGAGVRVSVDGRDLTKRLGKVSHGTRRLTLKRGRDFWVGTNRVVLSTGKGDRRRYTSRVFLAAKPAELLKLHRDARGDESAVEFVGHSKARLGRLLVVVNGKRLAEQRLLRHGGHAFTLQLGHRDGLRFGPNQIVVQGVSADGKRVSRLTRNVHLGRSAPLADAGADMRTEVGHTVRLRGSGSKPADPGDPLAYEWQLASSPQGSKAAVRDAKGPEPSLVADTPGRYKLRLLAAEPGKRVPADAGRPTPKVAAEGADVMTLEASIPVPSPLGAPIQTIAAGGGISVGGKLLKAQATWVQLLIYDRANLDLVAERSIDTEPLGVVGNESIRALTMALAEAGEEDLVVLSGGGRPVGISSVQQLVNLEAELHGDGIAGGPLSSPGGLEAFQSGQWSAIGIPGSEPGSGAANFSAVSTGGFGNQLPAGRPGSLQGYLHYSDPPFDPSDSDLGAGYGFVSPDHVEIDTQGKASSATVSSIEIGGKAFTTAPVPKGSSGFQLLLLNDRLEAISDHMYVTNEPGGAENLAGVEGLGQELFELHRGDLHPRLVILQSLGSPAGLDAEWNHDPGIRNYPWGFGTAVKEGPPVENNFSSWFETREGLSLAAGIGWLAGPAAHDQFAQMLATNVKPTPTRNGGYTLVVPYEEPTAAVSQSQVGSGLPAARVAGTLALNPRSNWEVVAPTSTAETNDELLDVVYETSEPWPDQGTAPFTEAERYIASELGLGDEGVRAAYVSHDTDRFGNLVSQLEKIGYPAHGYNFQQSEFRALKAQLELEFPKVEDVRVAIENWQKAFGHAEHKGQVDLAALAGTVEGEVEATIKSRQAELNTDLVVAHSLGIAAGIAGAGGLGPVAGPLGAFSNAFSLANDLSQTKGGNPSSAPIRTEAQKLGTELALRYEALDESLAQIQEVLVSDYGKLQVASKQATGGWDLNTKEEPKLVEALTTSGIQQDFTAMLPLAYSEYMISPEPTSMNAQPTDHPWTYSCYSNSILVGETEPFSSTRENPGSWLAFPYEVGRTSSSQGFETKLQSRVLAIQGDFTYQEENETGTRVIHEPHVLGQKVASKLFAPPGRGYGLDQVQTFGDPAFQRLPIYC